MYGWCLLNPGRLSREGGALNGNEPFAVRSSPWGTKRGLKQFNIFLLVPDLGTLCSASFGTKPRMHLGWV